MCALSIGETLEAEIIPRLSGISSDFAINWFVKLLLLGLNEN